MSDERQEMIDALNRGLAEIEAMQQECDEIIQQNRKILGHLDLQVRDWDFGYRD